MAKATWILTSGLMTMLAVFGSARPAAAQSLTVSLRIHNDAQVPEDVIARAQRQVTEIYAKAGVRAVWASDGEITLVLITRAMARKISRIPDAVGFAPTTDTEDIRGHVAYILAYRVDDLTSEYGTERGIVLGMAIAHEVGHLLLPLNAHSKTGIMRADWNHADLKRAALVALLFTDDQAALIRGRLGRHIRNQLTLADLRENGD